MLEELEVSGGADAEPRGLDLSIEFQPTGIPFLPAVSVQSNPYTTHNATNYACLTQELRFEDVLLTCRPLKKGTSWAGPPTNVSQYRVH